MCYVFLLYTLHFTHYTAFAQSISSTELITGATEYDGKIVSFQGEVIGDVMARGHYSWINVYDGTNALGIWIPQDLTKSILFTGNYKAKGDLVEVTGIFHHVCAQHGGDLDIHAQSMRQVAGGRQVVEKVNEYKALALFVLLGILVVIWILTRLKIR